MENTDIDSSWVPAGGSGARAEYRAWASLQGATGNSIGLVVELFAGGAWVISATPFRSGEMLKVVLMQADGREAHCRATVALAVGNRVSVRFLAMPRPYVDAFDCLLGSGEFSRPIPLVLETANTSTHAAAVA